LGCGLKYSKLYYRIAFKLSSFPFLSFPLFIYLLIN